MLGRAVPACDKNLKKNLGGWAGEGQPFVDNGRQWWEYCTMYITKDWQIYRVCSAPAMASSPYSCGTMAAAGMTSGGAWLRFEKRAGGSLPYFGPARSESRNRSVAPTSVSSPCRTLTNS
jgi:hypothetical protein